MTSTTPRRRKPQTPYANIEITRFGRTLTLRDWADELGIPYRTFSIRYQRGIRGDELFQPLRTYEKPIEYQGKTNTLSEWGRILNIPAMTLIRRHSRGDTGDRLFRPLDARGRRN